MQEAVGFVKKHGNLVAKLMTKEHQRLNRQFLLFKERTQSSLDQLEDYKL